MILGAQGDDTLLGNGGLDILNGGADDDILALLDPAFLEGFGTGGGRMVGGTGSDTLRLDGAGVSLDLGAIPDTRIQGIERVDLGGDGNTLALDMREILNIDDASNELTVLGDDSNAVSGSLPGATEGTDHGRRRRLRHLHRRRRRAAGPGRRRHQRHRYRGGLRPSGPAGRREFAMADLEPFPELIEGRRLNAERINGVDPARLTIGVERDAVVTFRDEVAAFENVLGVYLIDADGTIRDPEIVFARIEHADPLPGLPLVRPGGGPLEPGDAVHLNTLYPAADLEPGQQFGLFVVADGADRNPGFVFDGSGRLEFVNTTTGGSGERRR